MPFPSPRLAVARWLVVVIAVAAPPQMERFAGALAPGMRLQYEGNGQAQPAWTIDSVARDVSHAGRSDCVRVVLRTRPDQQPAETRLSCVAGDTLLVWSAAANAWRPQRVIAAERRLVIPGATSSVEVTTGAGEVDTIGARLVSVVPTVLLTRGANGQPTRRLTERYAPSLGTATLGVFEVADSTVAGGWRVAQRFKLLAVNP